jgi:hypothetical protein
MSKTRGAVELSYEDITKILHLREDLSVTGVKVDPQAESVTFVLSGEGLMPVLRRTSAPVSRLSELTDW